MKKYGYDLPIVVFFALLITFQSAGVSAENWSTPDTLTISDTEFSEPHDLAITPDGLYLMVADKGNNVVKILSPGDLRVIGEIGVGVFNSPHDVAISRLNKLYVADTENGRIMIYQFKGVSKYTGALIEPLGEWSEGITWPEGIAVGSGDRAYVADVKANAMLVLQDGKVIKTITQADGITFSHPHDVDIAPDGTIYLTDPGNDRIVVFDPELNVIRILTRADYGFDEPKYLAIDEDGMVFVADENNDRIVMLDRHMTPTGDIDEGILDIAQPEGVSVAGRYIWVSDTANNRIILFRRNRL